MDNDLMARRLRPPSEPVSAVRPTGPMPAPTWMQQTPPAPQAAAPEAPAARDEVPWDRPSDYAQATDTASAAEHAWDRPETHGWDDSAVHDDRTAEMLEPEPEIYGALVAAATASEPAVAHASASFAPASHAERQLPAAALDPADDPDDALAPVLDDVFANSASGWDEPMAYAEVGDETESRSQQNGDYWSDDSHSVRVDAAPAHTPSQTAAIEPVELAGRGLGPTPPPELFTEAPSLWSTAATEEASPAAAHEEPYQEPTFEQQPYAEPTFEQQAYQEPKFEQQPYAEPTFEQQPYAEPTFEQQPYEEPPFDDSSEVPVAVTAERAWQAYEAFSAEQEAEAPPADAASSGQILEIQVPQDPEASTPNAGKQQQLVLRIELTIVDSTGQRVDPSNVSVRLSPAQEDAAPQPETEFGVEPAPEPPASEHQPAETPAAATATPTGAFNDPPWPTATQSIDSGLLEPSAWLDPAPPPPVAHVDPPWQPAPPPGPVFTGQMPWSQRPPIDDPLSALSAPPPPTPTSGTPQTTTPTFDPPSFAPPASAPPAAPMPSNVTGSAAPTFGSETTEPRFRPPPDDAGSDGAAVAAAATNDSRKVALYTVGAGLVVVALGLLFLQMMTNIL